MTEQLVAVERVLADLLASVDPLGPETVPLEQALGRVLDVGVTAPHDLPPFDNAAMDGYAVRAADTAGASEAHPVRLALVGSSFAGAPGGGPEVGPGAAARIATGGALPTGADAVVRIERTTEHDDVVLVHAEVRRSADVRPVGEDLRTGDQVLPSGTLLGPGQLSAAAGTGHAHLRVRRRPSVAVVLTGDEIVRTDASDRREDHQIHDAAGPALTAIVRDAGGGAVSLHGPVPDDPGRLRSTLAELADEVDLLITVGGVSKGARDHLVAVLTELGEVSSGGVALRPGRPFRHGRVEQAAVLCLPGNPVAALVTAHVFVRPVVALLAGADPTGTAPLQAELTETFRQRAGRTHWVRARVVEGSRGRRVQPVGGHGSAMLHSLAEANAWMIVPAGAEVVEPGSLVDVVPTWGDRGRTTWRPT